MPYTDASGIERPDDDLINHPPALGDLISKLERIRTQWQEGAITDHELVFAYYGLIVEQLT